MTDVSMLVHVHIALHFMQESPLCDKVYITLLLNLILTFLFKHFVMKDLNKYIMSLCWHVLYFNVCELHVEARRSDMYSVSHKKNFYRVAIVMKITKTFNYENLVQTTDNPYSSPSWTALAIWEVVRTLMTSS